MLVCLDPGHGGGDPGAVGGPGGTVVEKDVVLAMALQLRPLLQETGYGVVMTRAEDVAVGLGERAAVANRAGADLFVSIHVNAAANPNVNYYSTWIHPAAPARTRSWAGVIHASVREAIALPDGGVREADLAVLRETAMPAVLLECGFISNPDQARRLTDPAWQRQVARGIAAGVAAALGRPPVPAGTPILAEPRASVAQAQTWARSRGATPLFILLAPLYWRLGPERGGVDPAAAYAQAARETAFGRFGGVLDESFRNPAGLKTREGGGDADPAAHQRFATWEEGVTAHLDHLALYAGAPGYPRSDTPDPRHFPFLRGAAPTVEALGGTWAPASDYGVAIVRNYLQPLVTTAPPPWEPADPWAAGAWAKAVALGVLDGTRPRDPLTRQELAVVLDRLGLLGTSAEAASSPGGPGRVGVVE